jgi:polyhydroxybutyrate depolymerase
LAIFLVISWWKLLEGPLSCGWVEQRRVGRGCMKRSLEDRSIPRLDSKERSRGFLGLLIGLVVLSLVAAGCQTASRALSVSHRPAANHPEDSGVIVGALRSGGFLRFYRVYVPTNPSIPIPVVVVLHGGLQTLEGIAEMTGFDDAAERRGFIAVYPKGIGRTFNAGECCGAAQRLGVDDIGFVRDLLEHLADRYDVDRSRIYATGISNGGLLTYRLACEVPGTFAAVAPVAATLIGPCSAPNPVSILHLHGLQDRNVPFKGGRGPSGLENVDWPPVMRGLKQWRRIDGCAARSSTERDGPVTRKSWTGCQDASDVTLYTLADGGHSWPGGQPVPDRLGPTSQSLDASKMIWRFFKAHPRA